MNIRKGLLQFVFSGFYMKRWNDKLRPIEFIEADKQAHKMIVAWLLCRLNGPDAAPLGPEDPERLNLEREVIEHGLFDYFFRLVITDIKPPVYYRIKENPDHYKKLTQWVLAELEPVFSPLDKGMWERMQSYLLEPAHTRLSDQILDAAHNYASNWELAILSPMNSFDPELPDIQADFLRKLNAHRNLNGMLDLLGEKNSALGRFAKLCGQLRFQKRWSQAPRIPETTVMGHMFLVACYAYFFSLSLGACQARINNNFFCALFHDLPELLTRDIISPVKKSIGGLGDLIRDYENEELSRRVLSPLVEGGFATLVQRLGFYLGLEIGSEFQDCIYKNGQLERVNFDQIQNQYNLDSYDPKDGRMLKACDNIAAFIEAYTALRNGIRSEQLYQALWRIRSEYGKFSLGNLHIGSLLADFD